VSDTVIGTWTIVTQSSAYKNPASKARQLGGERSHQNGEYHGKGSTQNALDYRRVDPAGSEQSIYDGQESGVPRRTLQVGRETAGSCILSGRVRLMREQLLGEVFVRERITVTQGPIPHCPEVASTQQGCE